MIKLITLLTKLIIVALTALFFASCNNIIGHKSIEGSGNVTTEKRIVQGDFKNVSVSNAIDLVIEQSDSTEIIARQANRRQQRKNPGIRRNRRQLSGYAQLCRFCSDSFGKSRIAC